MPKRSLVPPSNPFGLWLEEARARRGLSMEDVAADAGTNQSLLSYYKNGKRHPGRDMVVRLARALAPEDADEEFGRRLLNDGLRAAGYLPMDDGYGDPIESITQDVGYSDVPLDDEQRRRLRQSVDAVVIGFMEQQKMERRKGRN